MAKEFNFDNFVENLPDCYRKDENSNNYKLLLLMKECIDEIKANNIALFDSLDIYKATGYTLDLYGEECKCPRPKGTSDDKYRILILLKMAQRRAKSDHKSIISALTTALNLEANIFEIKDADCGAAIDILALPYDELHKVGVTLEEIFSNTKALLSAGVGINKFTTTQDVSINTLRVANAMTQRERFEVRIQPISTRTVTATLYTAPVITQREVFEVEVN